MDMSREGLVLFGAGRVLPWPWTLLDHDVFVYNQQTVYFLAVMSLLKRFW